jgi:hypothetical protein
VVCHRSSFVFAGFLPLFIGIHWVSFIVVGFQWCLIGCHLRSYGFLWLSFPLDAEGRGALDLFYVCFWLLYWLSLSCHWFSLVIFGSHWFALAFFGFQWFSMMVFFGLSLGFFGFHDFSCVFLCFVFAFCGFSLVLCGFHWSYVV